MAAHEFAGEVDEAGEPIVAQVVGSESGALAQVCSVCSKTANEDGTTTGH